MLLYQVASSKQFMKSCHTTDLMELGKERLASQRFPIYTIHGRYPFHASKLSRLPAISEASVGPQLKDYHFERGWMTRDWGALVPNSSKAVCGVVSRREERISLAWEIPDTPEIPSEKALGWGFPYTTLIRQDHAIINGERLKPYYLVRPRYN